VGQVRSANDGHADAGDGWIRSNPSYQARGKRRGAKPDTGYIIALTAHALKKDEQKNLYAGCDDHITKPIKKLNLIETLIQFKRN